MTEITSIHVVDSHTGGEPTRVVIDGGPDLGTGSMADRRQRFARDFDSFRSAVVNEPRGNDAIVGALMTPPTDSSCHTGVIFFNNVGVISMCVHGTIGLAATLVHLGELQSGRHRFDTSVGVVEVEIEDANHVVVTNVPSYRSHTDVSVSVDGYGDAIGDIAWGGNWFFLTESRPVEVEYPHLQQLTEFTRAIRRELPQQNITGENGGEIDHIEVFGPPVDPSANSKNFVLCPGGAYDRSPCGTGTSAKLACLADAGKLAPGEVWCQESILGSIFEGWYETVGDRILPHIRGSAWVNAESTLLLNPTDPFSSGIRSAGLPG